MGGDAIARILQEPEIHAGGLATGRSAAASGRHWGGDGGDIGGTEFLAEGTGDSAGDGGGAGTPGDGAAGCGGFCHAGVRARGRRSRAGGGVGLALESGGRCGIQKYTSKHDCSR